MFSDAADQNVFSLTAKKYLFKLRAYSGYVCGLVLAQVLALVFALSSAYSMGFSSSSYTVNIHSYSAQIVLIFSVVWAFIVAISISSRKSKDASFSFPGNRLTDSLSDLAFLLTCCLFGAVTTALSGAVLRFELLLFFPGNVIWQGFYPVFGDLCVVAAAAFFYMLLVSAVGFLSGTLVRINKVFIIIVAAVLVFINVAMLNRLGGLPVWGAMFDLLFMKSPLALFTLITAAGSCLLFALGTVISSRMEVK
jgi:hypothetical protein